MIKNLENTNLKIVEFDSSKDDFFELRRNIQEVDELRKKAFNLGADRVRGTRIVPQRHRGYEIRVAFGWSGPADRDHCCDEYMIRFSRYFKSLDKIPANPFDGASIEVYAPEVKMDDVPSYVMPRLKKHGRILGSMNRVAEFFTKHGDEINYLVLSKEYLAEDDAIANVD